MPTILNSKKIFPVLLLGLFLSGCYTVLIEDAFDGDFPPKENNEIIVEYCKSCHIHKDFTEESHVADRKKEYKRKVFRLTNECRVCHFLEEKWTHNDFLRKTRRPKEANRGKFRDFELDFLKEFKKRKKK